MGERKSARLRRSISDSSRSRALPAGASGPAKATATHGLIVQVRLILPRYKVSKQALDSTGSFLAIAFIERLKTTLGKLVSLLPGPFLTPSTGTSATTLLR